MKKYTIKPIKWINNLKDQFPKELFEIYLSYHSIFGIMQIEKSEFTGNNVRFSYHFTEYYDDGSRDFLTLEEANEYANNFYLERLLPALKEVRYEM